MRRVSAVFGVLLLVLVLSLSLWSAPSTLAQVMQAPLPGNKIAQFVDPLPDIYTIVADNNRIELQMNEFQSAVMPTGFVPANGLPYNGTWVWGYRQPGQPAGYPYIGPAIVATRGTPTEIKYVNNLGTTATSQLLAYTQSTDQTLHWANPYGEPMMMGNTAHYDGPIPAVPHLHGGEVPPVLDGGPDAWFTSDGTMVGHGYYSADNLTPKNYAIYRYPNTQEGAPIWFHDHTLGATRLNVYAGLAGAYLLTDPANDPANLPPLVPLVIQDRMFDTNGQLYFPNVGINPEHPYWIPEFVGDTIVVNGEVWPYKNVDRQRYTFLVLNGSNARAYDMSLVDPVSGVKGPPMWVIGTDGGYLDKPVLVDPNSTNKAIAKSLVSMPGERYQVIIDFNDPAWISRINTAYAAMGLAVPNPVNVLLKNTAKTPFPGGAPAKASTTGRIIQFRVSTTTPADTTFNPSTLAALRTPMVRLVNPATGTPGPGVTIQKTRQLTLNEIMGAGGPLEILVNNTKWTGESDRTFGDFTAITNSDGTINYYSEIPKEGETELWEIVNLTADAHPIHLHLVQFQLMNRQTFDVKGYNVAYNAAFPGGGIDPMTGLPYLAGTYMPGFGPPKNYNTPNADAAVGGNPGVAAFLNAKKAPATPVLGYEAGWKDTVIAYPGQVTRIVVRWAPTDIPVGGTGGNPATLHFPFDPNGGHGYVWHCHIIDHEDNEMMRPTAVEPKLGALRTYVLGFNY